jgi:Mn2+/Fe2+ NRAMP family transporter
VPIALALVLVQEMTSRLGVVTGQGLADLIRERFGVRITFYLMLCLVVTNFGNAVAEFAGVASAMEIFGVGRHWAVPVARFRLVVVIRTYSTVEKIFLAPASSTSPTSWPASGRPALAEPAAGGARKGRSRRIIS